jgi:hypothetical protein
MTFIKEGKKKKQCLYTGVAQLTLFPDNSLKQMYSLKDLFPAYET